MLLIYCAMVFFRFVYKKNTKVDLDFVILLFNWKMDDVLEQQLEKGKEQCLHWINFCVTKSYWLWYNHQVTNFLYLEISLYHITIFLSISSNLIMLIFFYYIILISIYTFMINKIYDIILLRCFALIICFQ